MNRNEMGQWKSHLLESLGGDEALLLELCEIFERNIDAEIKKFQISIANREQREMEMNAHKIKGMLSNFDHPPISRMIEELEEVINSGEQQKLPHLSVQFVSELRDFRIRLSGLRTNAGIPLP